MAVLGALSDAVSCEMRIHLQLPLEGMFQKEAAPGSLSARWGERSREMLRLLHWTALRVPHTLWMQPHHRIFCRPGLLQVGRKQVASDKTTSSLLVHSQPLLCHHLSGDQKAVFISTLPLFRSICKGHSKPKSSCILIPIPFSSDSQQLWEREQPHFPSFISGLQSRRCPRGRADVGCSCPQGSGSACLCPC